MLVFSYFLKEILPQFLTSFCIFSAILVISQLARISEILITFGLSLENLLLPFLFIILPFLSFTIPMAYLFAVLISFGRMSADGEYTALLAAGYSLRRAAQPVILIGVILFICGSLSALNLEPWGRREFARFFHRKAQGELDNMIKYRLQPGVFMEDFLGFVLYAETISPDRTRFENVLLAPGPSQRGQNFTLLAPTGAITGSVERGDLRMNFDYGVVYAAQSGTNEVSVSKFKRTEVDLLRIFQEQIFGNNPDLNDYRSLPPGELIEYIRELRNAKPKTNEADQERHEEQYRKANFLLHQRIGMPFSTVIFALFAMVLGIQDQRRGKGGAYIGAIFTLIATYVFTMSFKWLSEQGHMPALLAVWVPNFILLGIGGFVVYQRNRLPASEHVFDPRHLPVPAFLRARLRMVK